MSVSTSSDLITLRDIATRLPPLFRKLPHVVRGLILANDTRTTKPMGLGWAFERAVRQNPYGMALYYQDQQISYSQLNDWANQLAHHFLGLGLQKGDVVALVIENRPELLATVLGLAKIGVVNAMVNTSQTGRTLIHSINLVQPRAIVVGEECRAAVEEIRSELTLDAGDFYWFVDQNTWKDAGQAPSGYQNLQSITADLPRFNPPTSGSVYFGDGLFYIYTSGTTGLPKAVIFTHGRWMRAFGTYGHVMNLNADDVLYCTLPLYHATGMVICWACVIAGTGTFAIRRKFSASQFWSDVRKYDATALGYVGELCRYLVDAPTSPQDRQHRVRKMIGNGMRPNIWGAFKQRFGVREIFELYASSEGNVGFSNVFNFDNTVGFSPTPFAIVQYDKENEQPVRNAKGQMIKVAKGQTGLLIGEITKRAPFDGYTDPEKNKAVIFTDVFKKGDRYFNTGDLVRDIGYRHAQFVDRLGDTFRWKGENVSTTEVENLIAGHDKISEAVVYGVEINNTNGRAGMCAITLVDGATLTEGDFEELLRFFKSQLPAYAVPVFLRLQTQMETTGTFKYQKNNLKNQAFNPAACTDPLYVWLPSSQTYVPVSPALYDAIQAGDYRF